MEFIVSLASDVADRDRTVDKSDLRAALALAGLNAAVRPVTGDISNNDWDRTHPRRCPECGGTDFEILETRANWYRLQDGHAETPHLEYVKSGDAAHDLELKVWCRQCLEDVMIRPAATLLTQ